MMTTSFFNYNAYIFNNQNLFDGLPSEITYELFQHQKIEYLKKGDIIFEEEQEPQFVYKLVKGIVKKHVKSIYNREHVFYICTKGEFLGYHAAITQNNYLDSASAITDCTLLTIPKADFLEVVGKSKTLTNRLLSNLGHEFGVFINFTKLLAKYTVRERTALHLLVLYKKFMSCETSQELLINRNDLSSLIGASMEAVVRILSDFKDEQLISSHRSSIKILDVEGLIKATNIKLAS